eukprot:2700119-Pleurochrysis_carterae.AAC.1
MKANAASKAIFQNTLKHWAKSRPTLAKWLRLIEHDYALQRSALQARPHDLGVRDGRQGSRRCPHGPSPTPSTGACS